MMKTITTALGALLCLVGLVGFFSHHAMGMILTPFHDVLLVIAGAVALYYGLRGTEFQARYCCRVLGVVFALLGVVGFIVGPGMAVVDGVSFRDSNLLRLIPNQLMLGTADSVFNLIVGVIGCIAGFFPREKEIQIDMAATDAKQKVGTKS